MCRSGDQRNVKQRTAQVGEPLQGRWLHSQGSHSRRLPCVLPRVCSRGRSWRNDLGTTGGWWLGEVEAQQPGDCRTQQPESEQVMARRERPQELRWPQLMDKATAGAYLSLSERTIESLIAANAIKCRTIGTLIRIERDELDAWIEKQPAWQPVDKRKPIAVAANKSRRLSAVS